MLKNWLLRGDCHGYFDWLKSGSLDEYKPEETAIIILGDAGVNFYLNKTDERVKQQIEEAGYYLYLVRGNHEMRPQHLDGIQTIWDINVQGEVYIEPQYPHIRYFKDYGVYIINEYRCLVIGGAYSVDKWWRLARAGITDETLNNPKKTGWFADECLTAEEMNECAAMLDSYGNYCFDFVFSHTCPYQFQPVDLFLGAVDQSKVDKSMELWLDEIYSKIVVNFAYCFGHYHRDRVEAPHVEQYLNGIENLNVIAERWKTYDETKELPWWINKSPKMMEGYYGNS